VTTWSARVLRARGHGLYRGREDFSSGGARIKASADHGVTWRSLHLGTSGTKFNFVCPTPGGVLAGSRSNAVPFVFRDGFGEWQMQPNSVSTDGG
jgi:hypothetical protein